MFKKDFDNMSERLLNKYSNKFVSRWLILAIDIFISFFSLVLAYLLRHNFKSESIDISFVRYQFIFLLYIRVGCFFFYRSYTGIIRHTSIEDVRLIFKVITVSNIFAGIVSLMIRYLGDGKTLYYVPFSILFIDYFISIFLLIASRFFVKTIYDVITSEYKVSIGVLIYGAGYSGLITKNVLQNDKFNRYNILGFIDDNEAKISKTIEGIRVFSQDEALHKFFNEDKRIQVVVAINKISASAKRKISDTFLDKGVVVKMLPPVEQWTKGEFSINQIHNIRIEDLLERDPIKIDNRQISKELDGKIIMVTGAAGSIGSEIVHQLLNFFPSKIILIDQAESALYDLEFDVKKKIPNNTNVQFIVADITDRTRMRKIFGANLPNIVFHAAAYKHVPLMENNPYEAVKVNIVGTRIIADLAVEFKVSKFVMISTDKAVNPTNVMGATKRVAEMYTQSLNNRKGSNTRFIATRFGNVLGSNGSVIPLFKKQIEKGGPVTVTHPEITRYFMTIPEACQLVLEAGTMGQGGEVFIFDMGESVKIVDLAKKMITLSGLKIGHDIHIEYSGLRPGEKLYEELLNTNENTLPTHHSKIMKAQIVTENFEAMEIILDDIEKLLYDGTNKNLVFLIKGVVPEYVSNNSIYEELDEVNYRITH
jgi:FlaA1/EpsC-like NDP-sugar epimerase